MISRYLEGVVTLISVIVILMVYFIVSMKIGDSIMNLMNCECKFGSPHRVTLRTEPFNYSESILDLFDFANSLPKIN